ncbi:MAG: ABC transporter ATP-binding protein [Rhodobacteraceae bacterium]|nr:ABC transporter ATP-binding protein [Paracoccaceae bacterium]
MSALVEIDALSVRFGSGAAGLLALADVDLRVEAGQVVGVVGESGSGKSTLANSLGRLLPAAAQIAARQMRVADQDLAALSGAGLRAYRREVLSFIFQDPVSAMDPTKRVAAAMRLVQPDSTAILRQRLEAVGILDPERVLKAYPHELSGGMAQRVCIATALMREPRLLIADEPTAALDASLKREVMDLMFARCAELGTAVLFVSHDLGLVRQYCQRVLVMYAGRVVEERDTAALFSNPRHPYTQALLSADPGQIAPGARLAGKAWRPSAPMPSTDGRAAGSGGEGTEPDSLTVQGDQGAPGDAGTSRNPSDGV